MVKLDAENEYLRDSVFYDIFGQSILFDDMDHAVEYRTQLLQKNKKPSNIYTLKGDEHIFEVRNSVLILMSF